MSDDLIRRLRACANGIGSFKSHKGDYGICDDAADRLEAQEALLKEAMAALEEIEARDKLPTPSYGGVTPGQYAYVHRAGPFAEIARATLAKLRAHFDGEKE